MEKKSLFYVVGGVLLILSAVLSLFQGAMTFAGMMYYREQSFAMIFKTGQFRYYIRSMTGMAWLQVAVIIFAGLVLMAKAFLKDAVPDIVLVGLFGVLTAFAGISFLRSFIAFFREGNFWVKSVSVCTNLLMVVAYGGMAAIILLKDSFGGFFFVPALAVAGKAFLNFVLYAIPTRLKAIMIGLVYMPFGACLLVFVFDMVLVAALFAIGMAVKEN